MTLRIAIVGAPSSGKSTLAAALARHYGTPWVPEYLREFVDVEGRVPAAADQCMIAATQLAREDRALARCGDCRYLFCDTTPLMTAVYSRHYFGGIDAQLAPLADAHKARYALTLFAAQDLPWVEDGLQRDTEEVGRRIGALLAEELAMRGIASSPVSGDLTQRMKQVDCLLNLLHD